MTADPGLPIQRLTQTRGDIAQWLAQDAAARAQEVAERGLESPARVLGNTVNRLAGVALGAVADGLSHRAAQSPARTLVHAAGDAGRALLLPSAQDHPWALVGTAAAGGALLAMGCTNAFRPAGCGRWLAQWALPTLARAAVQALHPTRSGTD